MNRSIQTWSVCLLSLSAVLWLVRPSAGAEVDKETQKKIAATIYAAIHLSHDAGAPGSEAIAQYDAKGRDVNGPTFAWGDNVKSPVDQKVISWYCEVALLPEGWQTDAAHEAEWAAHRAGPNHATHAATGAQTYYRVAERNNVRRTRAYFRLVDGSVMLKLWEQREGDETAEQAIEKAAARWQVFVDQAIAQGLLSKGRIFVEVLPGPSDYRGLVADGGVVPVVHRHDQQVDVPIKLWAQAPNIKPAEGYWMLIQADDRLGRPGVSLVGSDGSALPDSNGDGWRELYVERGDTPAQAAIRFAAYKLDYGQDLRSQVVDQVVQIRIAIRRDEQGNYIITNLAAQRTDWFPVVTRMELVQRGWTPPYPDADTGRADEQGVPEQERNRYNASRSADGSLLNFWRMTLEPMARTRATFTAEEPVMLGWRINPYNSDSFYLAINSPQKRVLTGSPTGAPLIPVIDIQIICPGPPPEGSGGSAPGDDDMFGGGFDAAQRERDFRRFVTVDNLSLTIRRIGKAGVAMPGDESERRAAEDQLAKRLRGLDPDNDARPGTDAPLGMGDGEGGTVTQVLLERKPGLQLLDDYFPMDDRFAPVLNRSMGEFAVRVEGIYEMRLKADLFYKGEPDPRRIDVAIRYNVSPTGFTVRTLQYESQRVR